jgi:hypothetical protein
METFEDREKIRNEGFLLYLLSKNKNYTLTVISDGNNVFLLSRNDFPEIKIKIKDKNISSTDIELLEETIKEYYRKNPHEFLYLPPFPSKSKKT